MPAKSRKLRWLLRLGFVVALALTAFFGVRTALSALYWNDPLHADQTIEPWMPVGYIGRSWNVPPEVVGDAAGYDPRLPRRRSLEDIAERRGVPVADIIAQVTLAIQDFRAHD